MSATVVYTACMSTPEQPTVTIWTTNDFGYCPITATANTVAERTRAIREAQHDRGGYGWYVESVELADGTFV
jgi:hypothetical protein